MQGIIQRTLYGSEMVTALRGNKWPFQPIQEQLGNINAKYFSANKLQFIFTYRSQDYGAADNVTGGKVAFSANGDTILWRTSSNGVQISQYTSNFVSVPSLPSDAQIASDKLNNSVFYGASGSQFYISIDGGKTFTSPSSLGSSTSPFKVIANPSITGDVWVSTDVGIFHTTNSGESFIQLPGISQAWAIALGAPKMSGGYPAIFIAASFGEQDGYFRSDDEGLNWVQINDAAHGFGSLSANCLAADSHMYGR